MLTRQVSVVRTQYRAPVTSLRKETQAISSAPIGGLLPTGKENSRRFASQNRLRPLVAGLVN